MSEQAVAAMVGEESEMYICKRCGVAYELNIIDKGFGKPRFCPNCGYKEIYQ
jgi:DNA-directed RNA polymerase subunit RPC12/RpoP